jgi:alkylation response protein AidB-like acyl-CoA dehydrogenase
MLQRIADQQLVMVTNGASDWLDSSGTAERVDGGYQVSARKTFSSGSIGADLLFTSAVYDDPTDGATVLHFAVPLKTPGVTVLNNWRTMAMRASGSNDICVGRGIRAGQRRLCPTTEGRVGAVLQRGGRDRRAADHVCLPWSC